MQRNMRTLEARARAGTRGSGAKRRARAKMRRACRAFQPKRARIERALGIATGRTRVKTRVARLRRARGASVGSASPARAPVSAASPAARSSTRPVQTGRSQITYRPSFGRGTFRTMCVRTCDGFAFPVSLSTTAARFHEDAASCSAMCPGRELRLFATKARAGTVAKARDVETGQPYSALPFAFRYRKRYEAACACDFRSIAVEGGRIASGPVLRQEGGPAAPTPRRRPDFPLLPNVRTAEVQGPPPPPERTEGGVRIVGRSYFPN